MPGELFVEFGAWSGTKMVAQSGTRVWVPLITGASVATLNAHGVPFAAFRRARGSLGHPCCSILAAFARFGGRFCIGLFLDYRANRLIVEGIPNQPKIRKP